ncbi:MAG TPA: hypothetical protein EYQ86_08635 [Bacteroidetes bacterium]|nr:hypothetical protein [Bacteroidota bacterium]
MPTYLELEKLEINKMTSWYDLASKHQKNFELNYLKINNAYAFKVPGIVDDIFYNRIHLLDKYETLNKAKSFFNAYNSKWYIDIPCPNINNIPEDLIETLNYCGNYETLIFDLKKNIPGGLGYVDFKKVNIELWNKICEIFLSDADYEFRNRFFLLPSLLRSDDWHFYAMYIKRNLVGLGGIYIKNTLSAFSTTYILEEHRKQSFHESLINFRLNISKEIGAEYVIAQAYENSISYHNLIKCNFSLSYKSIYLTIR